MKSKGIFLAVTAMVLYVLAGCRHKKKVHFDPTKAVSHLNTATTLAAGHMLEEYYGLKDGLVQTNAGKAIQSAYRMKNAATTLQQQLRQDKPADSMMYYNTYPLLSEKADSIILQLDRVIASKNKDCEKMRLEFKPLSDATYSLLQIMKIKNIQSYHLYCPMAMNERGAYWLSASPEIENPYFGQKMLTCGELVDTIH